MNTQHTPGPWSLEPVEDRSIKHLCPVDSERMSLLTIVHQDETPFAAVYKDADAHLIAAAPDLLAELRKARAALKEQLEILIQSHSDPKTGLITDDADLRAIESDQDLINGIDRVIDQAEGGAA